MFLSVFGIKGLTMVPFVCRIEVILVIQSVFGVYVLTMVLPVLGI